MSEGRNIDVYDVTRVVLQLRSCRKAEVYEQLVLCALDWDRLNRKMNEARKLGYIQYGGKYWTPTEIGQWFLYLDNLKVSEASDVAKSRGCNLRVIRDGGNDMIVTADLDRTRVNVELKDGVVVRVFGLG
jgi:hypothetical protein